MLQINIKFIYTKQYRKGKKSQYTECLIRRQPEKPGKYFEIATKLSTIGQNKMLFHP